MEIKVLGTGCASCKALYTTAERVVKELQINADVEKVEDLMEIIKYSVMSLPALVVDNKVISSGRTLTAAEIKELLTK